MNPDTVIEGLVGINLFNYIFHIGLVMVFYSLASSSDVTLLLLILGSVV